MHRIRQPLICVLLASALLLASSCPAYGLLELKFTTAPALPTLPSVALNAKSQTGQAAMTNFAVEDTRLTKSGWNVTAQGQSGTGKSAVFAQYCPAVKCGTHSEGYVTGGSQLAAESLTLNSTGASFTGGLGTAPTLQCSSGCKLDGATPVKIASDASGTLSGEGTWTTSGFSATALSLTTPPTMRALANGEIYRVNILWTLSTGP